MPWHKRKPNAALKMHTRGMGHHPAWGYYSWPLLHTGYVKVYTSYYLHLRIVYVFMGMGGLVMVGVRVGNGG
jgi:hypothetical protein